MQSMTCHHRAHSQARRQNVRGAAGVPAVGGAACLVKLRDGSDEDARGHVVEAVDPLTPLVALAADVEHREIHGLDLEVRLNDAGGAHARAKDVVGGWLVTVRGQTSDLVEVELC